MLQATIILLIPFAIFCLLWRLFGCRFVGHRTRMAVYVGYKLPHRASCGNAVVLKGEIRRHECALCKKKFGDHLFGYMEPVHSLTMSPERWAELNAAGVLLLKKVRVEDASAFW